MKLILSGLAIFCFIHAYRDYLQSKGIKNWFTQIGHVWDAPKYEIHGMIVAIILGVVLIVIGIQI